MQQIHEDIFYKKVVSLITPFSVAELKAPWLNPEHPFGITAIIGGTNVRFCLSTHTSKEPLIFSVKWQELKEQVACELAASGREFAQAKDLVFPVLAKQFVDFVADKFEPSPDGPPFDKLCAFDFSVAGLVDGKGSSAKISTVNTGLMFREEQIALSLITTINQELRSRGWREILTENISVMNDAVAGLFGETLSGGLQEVQDGLFIILGTGVGSMGLVDGKMSHDFNELGHRVIRDSRTKETLFYGNDRFSELFAEDGSYKSLPAHQYYIENELAGPWAAIKFVKLLKEQYDDAFFQLAAHLSKTLERQCNILEEQLTSILDLNYHDRTQWAVNSPSDVIKGVNKFLFNPSCEALFAALPCDLNLEDLASRDADKALTTLGALRWKSYFKNVGKFLGEASWAMGEHGHYPERIVIAGGIGELCNTYEPLYKRVALSIIHEAAHLKPNTVLFSSMSPEAREASLTTHAINQAFANQS